MIFSLTPLFSIKNQVWNKKYFIPETVGFLKISGEIEINSLKLAYY